VTTQAIN